MLVERRNAFAAAVSAQFLLKNLQGKYFGNQGNTSLRAGKGCQSNKSDRSTYRGVVCGTDSWSLGMISPVRELTVQPFLYEGFDENESRDG
jgi:hypothetical protein